MAFTERELREDLHKVRIRKYLYLGGGLGILGLGIALFVISIVKRDWPALILAAIGAFWSVMLCYHYVKTRELEALIQSKSEGAEGEDESSGAVGEAIEGEPEATERETAGRGRDGRCSG